MTNLGLNLLDASLLFADRFLEIVGLLGQRDLLFHALVEAGLQLAQCLVHCSFSV